MARRTLLSSIFLLLLVLSGVRADSTCQQEQFNNLFASVQSAYSDLANLTELAESKWLECTYERITMNVTQLFLKFSSYDFNMTSVLCEAYRKQYGAKGCAEGEALPCRQLNKTADILNKAITDIKRLLNSPNLRRRAVPRHHMLGTIEKDGYLYRDGDVTKPVFPGGYDHGNYAFYYGFPSDVVPQVETVGLDSDEVVAHIATLLPLPFQVNDSEVQRILDTFDRLYVSGLTSGLVLMCKIPEWLVENIQISLGTCSRVASMISITP